jgi:hypothetical protein
LVELAALVYVTDQAISRGGVREFEYGKRFNRHFRFEVQVRRPEVLSALQDTLGFLSDDLYEFGFSRLSDPPPFERYLFADQPLDASSTFTILTTTANDRVRP